MTPSRPKLLLVEPDGDLGQEIARRLAGSFEVTVADGGKQALRDLELLPADVVLMELDLPGELGIGLLAELRRARANVVLVPMVTEGDRFSRIEAMVREVANDLLVKPVDLDRLDGTLTHLYRIRRADGRSAANEAGGALP